MLMNARQRAAQTAAHMQRERTAKDLAGLVSFGELGVMVRNGEVRKIGGGLRQTPKRLAGACAGVVIDRPRPSEAGSFVAAVVGFGQPRVGTIFVAFADGTRWEKKLYQGTRQQMQKVDVAIARFNAMADALS
jgi:hypothetical protein